MAIFVLPETLAPDKRRPFEWSRANPFGTFKVFQHYHGVLPLCVIMFVYFFASAVYPAIWPFWGIAKFGWSELVIGPHAGRLRHCDGGVPRRAHWPR